MPDWDMDEMQLMPGRHSKCLKHSNKNCFCIISFFSFALVFWNISWLTTICSAFEGFSLKRGIAVLALPQRSEKRSFSTSFLLQPSASITCPIHVPSSVVFLAVLQTLACKTNQGYKCLFTCLPAELVSSKKSQATAIFINTEDDEVQNHSGKT